jgi:hypothetical protein
VQIIYINPSHFTFHDATIPHPNNTTNLTASPTAAVLTATALFVYHTAAWIPVVA